MDWMPLIVGAIGSIRLILIFSGMFMLLQYAFKAHQKQEHVKQCFAISGIIYLLGLMPQSLLLLCTSADPMMYLLDNGYLCWIQNFFCITAVAIHTCLCFTWISATIHNHSRLCVDDFKAFLKWKLVCRLLLIYVVLLIFCRAFFLKIDDSAKFYVDVASRTDNSSVGWTVSSVQHPAQVIRLQFLLCETCLSENELKYFLIMCYILVFLPLALMAFFLKRHISKIENSSDTNEICQPASTEGTQPQAWWEQDSNIQKLLSFSTTFWYLAIQPAFFALQRQHFIDFGTHLLLTICVFVPWTISTSDRKKGQSWV